MADELFETLRKTHPWAFRERARSDFGEGEKELREYLDKLDDLQPFTPTTRYPWSEPCSSG